MNEKFFEVSHITKEFAPPPSLLSFLRLNVKQQKPVSALKDISFSLAKGKILGILGPNGAGKTTLLKIIATLILPEQGTILVNGCQPGKDDEKLKSLAGLVLDEERSFYWRLSGRQNLDFFAALYGLSRKASRQRINELLALFEVDYADKRFDTYSTGMKRRFALIRGIIHNPKLILLDEPTKSLDYPSAFHLRNFIKETLVKTQGKTIIFTTHHMDEALDFGDEFLILNKGNLLAFGTLEELRKTVNSPAAQLGEVFIKLTQKKLPC